MQYHYQNTGSIVLSWNIGESFSQGGLSYKDDGAVGRKIRTKQVKRTNLCMAQALYDPAKCPLLSACTVMQR